MEGLALRLIFAVNQSLAMPKRLLHFLSLLFIFSTHLSGQELHYEHYTMREGMLQMQVTTLFQDSKGYMWVGTKLGASRFDGRTFRHFTNREGLPGFLVTHFAEDSKGNIYILTRNGLAMFDGAILHDFTLDAFKSLPGQIGMFVKPGDSLFIYSFNNSLQLEEHYFDGKALVLKNRYFEPCKYGDILEAGTMAYDSATGNIIYGNTCMGINVINRGKIRKIAETSTPILRMQTLPDGSVAICTENKLFMFKDDVLSEIPTTFPHKPKGNIHHITADKEGKLYMSWKSEPGRLFIFDGREWIADHHDHKEITKLFVDRDNNLWVGTEYGLYRNNSRAVWNFVFGRNGITDQIWTVAEDRNGAIIFASFNKGLQEYYNNKLRRLDAYIPLFENGDLLNFYPGSLKRSDGDIYFTISAYAVMRYDGKQFYRLVPDSLKEAAGLIVFEDPDNGHLLVGSSNGLYEFGSKGLKVLPIRPGNRRNQSIVAIAKDIQGNYWLGGFNGITLMKNNELRHLPDSTMKFNFGAVALHRDAVGFMWIGNGNGLYHYNYQNFRKIDHPGLNDFVSGMIAVGDTALLVSTSRSIFLLDLKTFYHDGRLNIMQIGPDKGFYGMEPNQNSFMKDSKGNYWLCCSDRVVKLDISRIKPDSSPPSVYINDVYLAGDKMRWRSINNKTRKEARFYFTKGETNFRFGFIGISHRHPAGVVYSHYLEGLDKGWSPPETENSISYTNLRPGKYTLKVKAANTDGVWSEPADYAFVIVPAFYQRIWFVVLAFVMAAAALFYSGMFIDARRRRHKQELHDYRKKMSEYRLLNIIGQIEPHFTNNALSAINNAILRDERDKAYDHFVKLSRLISKVLDTSTILTRSLEEEMRFVSDYLDLIKFRLGDRFNFVLNVEPDVDQQRQIPKMCIQTFVENAVKHGIQNSLSPGVVEVYVGEDQDDCHIFVTDNGIGREQAARFSRGTGKGLMILDSYIEYFNQQNTGKMRYAITDLKDEQGNPAGTSVEIRIPRSYVFNNINNGNQHNTRGSG